MRWRLILKVDAQKLRLLTYVCIVQTQFEKEIKIVCVVGLGIQLYNLAYYIYIYIFSFSQVNRQFHTSYIVSIQKEREREKGEIRK